METFGKKMAYNNKEKMIWVSLVCFFQFFYATQSIIFVKLLKHQSSKPNKNDDCYIPPIRFFTVLNKILNPAQDCFGKINITI